MLYIYNTITRKKELFKPINKDEVKMYVCGMTVYDYCHLGHARVLVVFDMISKWLRQLNYKLTYVRNITDIDDKIIEKANKNNESIQDLTFRFIKYLHDDCNLLGVDKPDFEPKATDYINEMISMIKILIDKSHAYKHENGDVFYSVKSFPTYGRLSGKDINNLRSGERVSVNLNKKDPLDFVLWKKAKPGEPFWDSPFGKGRPGWHIECSAMSNKLLGEVFDIHGGGSDLQFPHHENEIAQSCGCISANKCFHNNKIVSHVKYWVHNGFVRVNDEKMSKSLGNFFTIKDVLKKYDPEVLRFFLLRTHYRSAINYSVANLEDAKSSLYRMYNVLRNFPPIKDNINFKNNPYIEKFYNAMNDDFNTTEAIAILFELSTIINKTKDIKLSFILKFLANILGFLKQDPLSFLQKVDESISTEEINELINQRSKARADKNWVESDRIRDLLLSKGVVLEDSSNGTIWRKN